MKADVLNHGRSKALPVQLNWMMRSSAWSHAKIFLHRCVVYQLAKRQQGTHKAKERGEVSGDDRRSSVPSKRVQVAHVTVISAATAVFVVVARRTVRAFAATAINLPKRVRASLH